jgi:hypothetical protein
MLQMNNPFKDPFQHEDSGDDAVLVTEGIAENKPNPKRLSSITDKF